MSVKEDPSVSSNTDATGVCPDITDITEHDRQLPYGKRLESFKCEVESLYEFALLKGLSHNQIRTCLSPILGEKKSIGKRVTTDSSKSFLYLSIIVALLAILWGIPTSRNLIIVHAKLLSVRTISLWDWTYLYYEDCIFNNPFLDSEKNFTKDDCQACIGFKEIDRLKDVDLNVVTKDYLYAEMPYVVTDADKNWPVNSNGELLFSIDQLNELFKEHPLLTEAATDCEFFSTSEQHTNISLFIDAIERYDLPEKFHVAWENCDVSAAKVFRMLASRPYFIPAFAELSPHNQVVVASGNYEKDEFDLPQQIDSATWMIVINGAMKITLHPHKECLQYKCHKSSFYLEEGEGVVVPSRVWNMSYTPAFDSYTLAYASTLIFDEVS